MNRAITNLLLLTIVLQLAALLWRKQKEATVADSPFVKEETASLEFISKIEANTAAGKERLTERKHQKAVTRIGA
jgi:hypothetical protein